MFKALTSEKVMKGSATEMFAKPQNTLQGFFASVTQVTTSILFCASETALEEEHLNCSCITTGFHRRRRRRTGGLKIKCRDFLSVCILSEGNSEKNCLNLLPIWLEVCFYVEEIQNQKRSLYGLAYSLGAVQ